MLALKLTEFGHVEGGDTRIGHACGSSPADTEGSWPCLDLLTHSDAGFRYDRITHSRRSVTTYDRGPHVLPGKVRARKYLRRPKMAASDASASGRITRRPVPAPSSRIAMAVERAQYHAELARVVGWR
jgi:hypothetical protein